MTHLIEKTFARENKLFLACKTERAFFTNDTVKYYTMWNCLDVCKSLSFLLDNIYVRFWGCRISPSYWYSYGYNEREEFMQETQHTQQTATRKAQNQDKKTA